MILNHWLSEDSNLLVGFAIWVRVTGFNTNRLAVEKLILEQFVQRWNAVGQVEGILA